MKIFVSQRDGKTVLVGEHNSKNSLLNTTDYSSIKTEVILEKYQRRDKHLQKEKKV